MTWRGGCVVASGELITVEEAAQLLGIKTRTVHAYASEGRYGIRKIDNMVLLSVILNAIQERSGPKRSAESTRRVWSDVGNCRRCEIIFDQNDYPDTARQDDGLCLSCHEFQNAKTNLPHVRKLTHKL